jgi:hypothetical protein
MTLNLKDILMFDSLINNRQEKGETISWLDESERFDVNPMLINYKRANTIRAYKNLPLIEPTGYRPQIETTGENEPAEDTAGTDTAGLHYLTVNRRAESI